MDFTKPMTNVLRRVFNDGLDEVLIFVFIFIFILLTGRTSGGLENDTINGSFLPIILIGAFLLLNFGFGRAENEQ